MNRQEIKQDICRICLDENVVLNWNNMLFDFYAVTFRECYYKYTQLECPAVDEHSTMLCQNCLNGLQNTHTLILRALESHKFFEETKCNNLSITMAGYVKYPNISKVETIVLDQLEIEPTKLQEILCEVDDKTNNEEYNPKCENSTRKNPLISKATFEENKSSIKTKVLAKGKSTKPNEEIIIPDENIGDQTETKILNERLVLSTNENEIVVIDHIEIEPTKQQKTYYEDETPNNKYYSKCERTTRRKRDYPTSKVLKKVRPRSKSGSPNEELIISDKNTGDQKETEILNERLELSTDENETVVIDHIELEPIKQQKTQSQDEKSNNKYHSKCERTTRRKRECPTSKEKFEEIQSSTKSKAQKKVLANSKSGSTNRQLIIPDKNTGDQKETQILNERLELSTEENETVLIDYIEIGPTKQQNILSEDEKPNNQYNPKYESTTKRKRVCPTSKEKFEKNQSSTKSKVQKKGRAKSKSRSRNGDLINPDENSGDEKETKIKNVEKQSLELSANKNDDSTEINTQKNRKWKKEEDKSRMCSICSKICNKYRVKHHEATHFKNRERKATCQICGLKYYDKISLGIHQLTHNENREKTHKCDFCPKAFYNKGALNIHRRIHLGQMIPCTLCSKQFYRQIDLERHMVSHSATAINSETKKRTKYSVRCKYCNKSVPSTKFKSHTAVHLNTPLMKCNICNKDYFSRNSCVIHVKKIHQKTNDEYNDFITLYTKNRISRLYLEQTADILPSDGE